MNSFAGNMLQVENKKGEKILVMSARAFNALTLAQVRELEKYNHIIYSALDSIETNGGGSARCMIAEIFLGLADWLHFLPFRFDIHCVSVYEFMTK